MEKIKYEYNFHKHYNLKIKEDVYVGKGLCGLINLRNTCFMSSILQCLSNTLSLTDYFLSCDYESDLNIENKARPEQYLLMSYLTLINNIWDMNQIIKPKSFVENLSKFHRKYFSMKQQDSHECLLYIMDLLHKSLSYEIDMEISGEVKSESDALMKKSIESWGKFYEGGYSYLIEIFNGNIINTIVCNNKDCKVVDKVFEPYNTISIDLTGDNLIDCLANYFKPTKIKSWTCDKCKCSGCTKDVKLWWCPNYLIINLKRFTSNMSKNNMFIDFPLNDLDITSLISEEKTDGNSYVYDLYAINHHNGDLDSGHYYSSCKNLDGNWYNYNDDGISKYNSTTQLYNDAYILFYRRKMIKRLELMV